MDWIRFLDDYKIEYVTRGPNVAKGNLNIACPLCEDDPSHHLGIELTSEKWGCWRASNHAGKKAHNLIRAVLRCSLYQAKEIAHQYSVGDPANLDEALEALTATNKPDKKPTNRSVKVPDTFKRIKCKGTTKRFYEYIKNRGFRDPEEVADLYRLRCATTGYWQDRIIIPIYINNKLKSWTSRALGNPKNAPRYLALSEEQGGLVNVYNTIFNWDELMLGGRLLIVTEGPFDAIKMDYFGELEGVRATCTFGTSMSNEQAMLIDEVSRRFKKTVLLYDEGATEAVFNAMEKLSHTNVEFASLIHDVEDPGSMNYKQIGEFIDVHI